MTVRVTDDANRLIAVHNVGYKITYRTSPATSSQQEAVTLPLSATLPSSPMACASPTALPRPTQRRSDVTGLGACEEGAQKVRP